MAWVLVSKFWFGHVRCPGQPFPGPPSPRTPLPEDRPSRGPPFPRTAPRPPPGPPSPRTALPEDRRRRGTAREPKRAHHKHHQKNHEKTPRETKRAKMGLEREKSAKFWAPTLRPPLFERRPSGPPLFLGWGHVPHFCHVAQLFFLVHFKLFQFLVILDFFFLKNSLFFFVFLSIKLYFLHFAFFQLGRWEEGGKPN